jgi:polar amino acid transport system ATP-binding protein
MHISLQSLTKRYGKVRALDNASLEIEPGQIVSVLGTNGAGKTTLLRCLSSIVAPSAGEIRYDGEKFFAGHRDEYFSERQQSGGESCFSWARLFCRAIRNVEP